MFSNDVIIDTHEKKNESKSLKQMCIDQNQYFLIRVKDITSHGILSTISSEEYEDEFDIDTVKINKKGIENEISEKTKETQHLF